MPAGPACMCVDGGRKLEYLERTSADREKEREREKGREHGKSARNHLKPLLLTSPR